MIDLNRCRDYPKIHIRERPCVASFEQLVKEHASPEFQRRTTNSNCDPRDVTTTSDTNNEITSMMRNCAMNVDLVQIDVEGKDFDVIQLIDFNWMIPQCIHYESSHLGGKE
jgi:hypothetical protein